MAGKSVNKTHLRVSVFDVRKPCSELALDLMLLWLAASVWTEQRQSGRNCAVFTTTHNAQRMRINLLRAHAMCLPLWSFTSPHIHSITRKRLRRAIGLKPFWMQKVFQVFF